MCNLRVFIILGLLFAAPWARAQQDGSHFIFDYPVDVFIPTAEGLKNPKKYKAGQSVALEPTKLYWLQSPGRVPVIVVPRESSLDGEFKIQLPKVADWPPTKVDGEIDVTVGRLLDLMTSFQVALSKKDTAEAQRLLTQMKSVRDVPSLDFLQAYLDFVKGNIEEAKQIVNRGLQRYPANAMGADLLNAIKKVNHD